MSRGRGKNESIREIFWKQNQQDFGGVKEKEESIIIPSLWSCAEMGESGIRIGQSTGKNMRSIALDMLSLWVFEKSKWQC